MITVYRMMCTKLCTVESGMGDHPSWEDLVVAHEMLHCISWQELVHILYMFYTQ